MEWERPSGLVVRAYDRDDAPNPNPPIGTVGPHTPAGDVMDVTPFPTVATTGIVPPGAQAWSGYPAGWTVPWSNWSGLGGLAGQVSILWLALDINTSILSTMPAYVTRGAEPLDDQPAWLTNPQPEVYPGGWGEFLRQLFTAWWLGEAFVWATSRYANGWPRTFTMLNPSWVQVEWDGPRRRYTLGGVDITADTLHLPYRSWPGDLHGHGPIEAAGRAMGVAAAAEQFMGSLAAGGGIPWAALSHPSNLTAKQTDDLRARYVEARLGARQLGQDAAPLILSGGLTLQPIQVSTKDLAIIEMMQLSEARVGLLFGVPPYLLNLPTGQDSLTYNNASEFRLQHWQIYLKPKAQQVMDALSGWLLPRGTAVELDREAYIMPPFNDRMAGYEIGIRAGIIEPDEARARERLGPRSEPSPGPSTGTTEPAPSEPAVA